MNESTDLITITLPGDKTAQIPQSITTPPYATCSQYTPEIAAKILYDVAHDTTDTIVGIQERMGIKQGSVYIWGLVSPHFLEAWYYVRAMREAAKVDALEATTVNIINRLEDPSKLSNEELRAIDCRIRLHRVHSLNVQWGASRLNPRYRQQAEVDVRHHDNPNARRMAAWQAYKSQATDAETTDAPDDNTPADTTE